MEIAGKEYEILVRRRGEAVYAAFCPQLNLIVNGTAHQQVEEKMRQLIMERVMGATANPASEAETK